MKSPSADHTSYVGVFLSAFFLCILINSGSLNSVDAMNRLQVTHWLWSHVPQVLPGNGGALGMSAIGRDGQRYVTWGIGQSLVMLPADIVSTLLINVLHLQRFRTVLNPGLVSYLTFPLVNAASLCFAFGVLREIHFSRKEATVGAFALLFCTTFLTYAQVQQENSLMLLCLLGGAFGNLAWFRTRRVTYLTFGVLSLGFGLLIRLPSMLDAASVIFLVVILQLLSAKRTKVRLKAAAKDVMAYIGRFALLYTPFIVIDRFYQWFRFGSLTTTYTSIWGTQMRAIHPSLPVSFPFSTPFMEGFLGQLFSPDRSALLFNPLLVLTVFMLVRFRATVASEIWAYVASAIFLLVSDIAIYSRWFEWGGAGAWGPRYAVVPSQYLELICVPLLFRVFRRIETAIERRLYEMFVLLSAVIQLLSVLLDYNLELSQEITFHTKYVIIWQRLVNCLAIATHKFYSSGLAPNVSAGELHKWTTFAFMPWRTAGEISPKLTLVLQVSWCFALVIYLIALARYIVYSRLRSETDSPNSPPRTFLF